MNPALLCETVTGATTAELVAARDAAVMADMVELRLDGVRDLDLATALHARRRPAVATCRPTWEGGRFAGSEGDRRRILLEALERGAEYVDVEWRALREDGATGFAELVNAGRNRVVVSAHDFIGVPVDLQGQVRAMRRTGAAVIKVAVTPRRLSDTLPLREVAKEGDAVVIGMGDAGVPTRLLASRFGSRWTYGGQAVAPGQVPASRMVHEFRFRTVDAGTAIYGVAGSSMMRALLPEMTNAAFADAGLNAVCVPLAAADVMDLLAFAEGLGMAGVSLMDPCAVETLPDAIGPDARAAETGAITAIRRAGAGWLATDTRAGGQPARDDLAGIVGEAERQFEWWTGRRPDTGIMRAALLATGTR